jgi:hypothetical protein
MNLVRSSLVLAVLGVALVAAPRAMAQVDTKAPVPQVTIVNKSALALPFEIRRAVGTSWEPAPALAPGESRTIGPIVETIPASPYGTLLPNFNIPGSLVVSYPYYGGTRIIKLRAGLTYDIELDGRGQAEFKERPAAQADADRSLPAPPPEPRNYPKAMTPAQVLEHLRALAANHSFEYTPFGVHFGCGGCGSCHACQPCTSCTH